MSRIRSELSTGFKRRRWGQVQKPEELLLVTHPKQNVRPRRLSDGVIAPLVQIALPAFVREPDGSGIKGQFLPFLACGGLFPVAGSG